MAELEGLHAAFLTANEGVEQIELETPLQALRDAGVQCQLIAPHPGQVQAFRHFDRGDAFPVTQLLGDAVVEPFDVLVLPGGVANPDALRQDARAVTFVRNFLATGKTVAAICHAPWLLVEADVVRGRQLTSWPSLRTDIENAGGTWVDHELVIDGNLLTSRRPADLPVFCGAVLEVLRAMRASAELS